MIRKLFFLLTLLFVSVTSIFAQAFDPTANVPQDPEVRKGVLDNGLTYYIRHNSKPEKQAEFFIFHNVGAMQEDDTQQGLAHFLEHMAFNGTKNLPDKQLINWLETIGVKFGANLNAGTGMEMTVYMMSSVPVTRESIIDSSLLILHDWSYFIALEGDEIDKERGVIIEELRTTNNANWRIREKSAPYLFGDTKYAHRNLIGYEDSLRTFEHDELRDFYHRWYRTDQQAIVVVGDFDVDMMESKIKAVMADIPAVENPEPKEYITLPANEEPVVGVLTDPELTNTSVMFYIKRNALPAEYNNLYMTYLMGMMDYYINTMANERLRDIAQKPGAPFTSARLSMNGTMTTTTDAVAGNVSAREGEALQAFEAFYREVEKMARYGFTESEFERAKTQILRSAQQQYDNRNDRRSGDLVWIYIQNFRNNNHMPSAEDEWDIDQKMIDFIDLSAVNQFLKMRLVPQNQIVLVTAPEKEGVYIPTQEEVYNVIESVRQAEIEAPVDDTVTEPLIPESTLLKGAKSKKATSGLHGTTQWELKNGVKIIVKPTDFKADEILVNIATAGGHSVLPAGDVITAQHIPAYMAQAGVGKFDASSLRKQLTGKAVSLKPFVSAYSNGFTGSVSPKDMETMMQLIYLYLSSPRYDESDFDVMIDRMKAQYANIGSNPMFILNDTLMNAMYDHNPRRQILTIDRIDKIEYPKIWTSYDRLFGAGADFTFTFVGNIDMDEFKPLVEKYLGSLPKSKKSLNWKDDGVRYAKGQIDRTFKVPMQMPKTTVLYVMTGDMPYTLENKLALSTFAQVLNIRYQESVREEKGGTYGVHVQSDLDYLPLEEYMVLITFDTDPAMADELSEIIFEEIEKIAAEGLRADDLAKVKEYYAKQHPDDLKQNSYWRDIIGEYNLNGRDMDNRYMDIINGFTTDYFKSIATKVHTDGNIVKIMMSSE